jgi:hypothetical protein
MGHTFMHIPQVCPTGGAALLLATLAEGPRGFLASAIALKYSSVYTSGFR